ncbi:MAG TPA: prephenate dehydratase domain-containing protein, partial [Terriglobales bacterium]
MRPRVAFQGERGAFSEEGAQVLFNNEVETVPCATFELLFTAVRDGRANYALAPLENTLAGHVTRCYDLLYESDLWMRAEIVRPIHHCLVGVPGARVDNLQVVQSHPVALAQCETFFVQHPGIKRTVAEDTAGSVREVMERGDRVKAAIAGAHAAEVYGATILRSNIEDYPENFTRFALLGPKPADAADANKHSLAVKLRHESGSLYHALEPFAKHGINLANLLCRPLKRSPWQYLFFLDFLATPSEQTDRALQQLRNMAEEVRVLGS